MTMLTVGDLSFEVRHSTRRRTIGITVDRDGQLIIACRPEVSHERLEEVIENKRLWIYDKLLQKESLNSPTPSIKEYVSGEGFYYLGRSYRLKLIEGGEGQKPLRLYQGRFFLHQCAQTRGKELFVRWYGSRLHTLLQASVPELARRVGGNPLIQVRELGYRWGSCSHKGDIYFHWRVAMLPRPIIDYIIAHELVHLIEHQHSTSFWSYVQQIIPDFEDRKTWLAEQGVKYNL